MVRSVLFCFLNSHDGRLNYIWVFIFFQARYLLSIISSPNCNLLLWFTAPCELLTHLQKDIVDVQFSFWKVDSAKRKCFTLCAVE